MNVAMLIAVDNHRDPRVPSVKFAAADVAEFGRALQEFGFDAARQVVLVNADATKTIIESKFKTTLNSLTANDTFFFYFVGHAFSHCGNNHLACHDTQASDLVETSIALKSLFQQIDQSSCQTIAMFLDPRESNWLATEELHDIVDHLDDDELRDNFPLNKPSVCFVACQSEQSSWPSGQNKHGAWAFQLIEAFRGNVPAALELGVRLTADSLQHHLLQTVPQMLALEYTDKRDQTPWTCGTNSNDFLLADLSNLFAKRKAAAHLDDDQVKRVAFVCRQTTDIRSLSGFNKKTHKLPDGVTGATESFIAKIAATEIETDLLKLIGALRQQFRFKRLELNVALPGDGTGTIITPHFTYSLSVSLNPENTSEVIWLRQVSEIKEPDRVLSNEFASIFDRMFDTVEFSPFRLVDVAALIDRIETFDNDQIAVEYGMHPTSCRVRLAGIDSEIQVTERSISMIQRQPQPPKQLLESLFQIQTALLDNHDVRLIAFHETKKP